MNQNNRLLRGIILSLLLLVLTYALIKLFPVYSKVLLFIGKLLLPFILAAFISYLLHPLVAYLERRWKWTPAFAMVIIFLLFAGVFAFLMYKSVPIFIRELEELSEQLPELIKDYENMILTLYESTAFLPEAVHDKMDVFINGLETRLDEKITLVLENVFHVSEFIVLLAVVPVLVFYFLKDKETIIHWGSSLLPVKWREKYIRILSAIDDSLGNYIRGQLLLSLAVVLVTYLIYYFLGLKFALLLAVFMGLMNIIPYFGPLLGSVPAVAITATISYKLVMILIIANAFVQLLESSLLSPYIMGKNVHIHPVLLIFLLLLGAEAAGVIGMIIIVPTATILRGVFRELKKE